MPGDRTLIVDGEAAIPIRRDMFDERTGMAITAPERRLAPPRSVLLRRDVIESDALGWREDPSHLE
jgi:hypothetical protein